MPDDSLTGFSLPPGLPCAVPENGEPVFIFFRVPIRHYQARYGHNNRAPTDCAGGPRSANWQRTGGARPMIFYHIFVVCQCSASPREQRMTRRSPLLSSKGREKLELFSVPIRFLQGHDAFRRRSLCHPNPGRARLRRAALSGRARLCRAP